MTLADYLKHRGLTQVEFARLVGVSKSAITLYLNGDRVPRPAVAERIIKITKGRVTANDLMFAKRARAA